MFEIYQKQFGFWYLVSICGTCLVLLCVIEAYQWLVKKAIGSWNAKHTPANFI